MTKEEILDPHIYKLSNKVDAKAALECMEVYKDQEVHLLKEQNMKMEYVIRTLTSKYCKSQGMINLFLNDAGLL